MTGRASPLRISTYTLAAPTGTVINGTWQVLNENPKRRFLMIYGSSRNINGLDNVCGVGVRFDDGPATFTPTGFGSDDWVNGIRNFPLLGYMLTVTQTTFFHVNFPVIPIDPVTIFVSQLKGWVNVCEG